MLNAAMVLAGGAAGRDKQRRGIEGVAGKAAARGFGRFRRARGLARFPLLQGARGGGFKGNFFADNVLPGFRATGVAWASAKYPDQTTRIEATRAAEAAYAALRKAPTAVILLSAAYAADRTAPTSALPLRPVSPAAPSLLPITLFLPPPKTPAPPRPAPMQNPNTHFGPLFRTTRHVWKKQWRLPSSPGHRCGISRKVNRTNSNPCGRK